MRKVGAVAVLVAAVAGLAVYIHGHRRSAIESNGSQASAVSHGVAQDQASTASQPPAQQLPSLSDQFPEQVDDVAGPDIAPGDLAATVAQELAQIHSGITVADWRSSHPADGWHRNSYASHWEGDFGDYCAVFKITRNITGGGSLTRKAAFLIPAPPASMAIPDDADAPALIEKGCVLGNIQIEVALAAKGALEQTTADIQAALSTQFGPAVQEPDPRAAGVFRNEFVPAWKKADATVRFVSTHGHGPLDPRRPETDLLVYSALPSYYHEILDGLFDVSEPDVETSPEIFQLAMTTAALDTATSQPMLDLYRKGTEFMRRPDEERKQLPLPTKPAAVAGALQQWLRASMNLPPQRRAAALLAADFVLEISWRTLELRSTDVVETESKLLEAIGVEFTDGGPRETTPRLTWLREAFDLDRTGPIGDELTFMSLASKPWTLWIRPRENGNGDDVMTYLIDAGTNFLSRPRDPATTARVEYSIASAYCDRVAMSEGSGDGFDSPAPPTQAQIDLARGAWAEALKYYRSMLAIDKNSTMAEEAWRSAWKLLAGLPQEIHTAYDPAY